MNDIEIEYSLKKVKIKFCSKIEEVFSLLTKEDIIITNDVLYDLYSTKLLNYNTIIIPDGEEFKNINMANCIYKELYEKKVNRNSRIIGFGGGVICDISAFVASTFKRGTKLILIPTTVIAQADAAIGGKTAVNYKNVKNIIGTFYHAEEILICISFLITLSEEQYRNGLAEIIKIALVSNRDFFDFISKNAKNILNYKSMNLQNDKNIVSGKTYNVILEMICKAINLKCELVLKDEFDNTERKKLNFGHTIGHCIESIYGLQHGEAVSIGMIEAAKISYNEGFLLNSELNKISNLLKTFGLPTEFDYDYQVIEANLLQDKKKTQKNKLDFIYIQSIGIVFIRSVFIDKLRKNL